MARARKEPSAPAEPYSHPNVIERPDGFYWRDEESSEVIGPFPTIAEAIADMEHDPEESLDGGATLQEAEKEAGISEWVDPETGSLAEDGGPRLEDH